MKKFVSLLLALILVLSLSAPAFAMPELPGRSVKMAQPSTDDPNVEQTVWILRNNNGYLEKRLWSITYRKWLTDWVVVGVAIDP